MDEALAEDIAMLERQQLGMDSPFARAGRWSDLERGAAALRRVVRKLPGALTTGAGASVIGRGGN